MHTVQLSHATTPTAARASLRRLAHRALAVAAGLAFAGHANATTYTVPLSFTMEFDAPTCTLSVNSVDATSTTIPTGSTIDLTPGANPSALSNPVAIVNGIAGTTTIAASTPGVLNFGIAAQKQLTTGVPAASATCTAGTPMSVSVEAVSTAPISSPALLVTLFKPVGAKSGGGADLQVAMMMGISSFGGVATGAVAGTTTHQTNPTPYSTNPVTLTAPAGGAPQALVLTATMYAQSSTALTVAAAGTYTWPFNVKLVF